MFDKRKRTITSATLERAFRRIDRAFPSAADDPIEAVMNVGVQLGARAMADELEGRGGADRYSRSHEAFVCVGHAVFAGAALEAKVRGYAADGIEILVEGVAR